MQSCSDWECPTTTFFPLNEFVAHMFPLFLGLTPHTTPDRERSSPRRPKAVPTHLSGFRRVSKTLLRLLARNSEWAGAKPLQACTAVLQIGPRSCSAIHASARQTEHAQPLSLAITSTSQKYLGLTVGTMLRTLLVETPGSLLAKMWIGSPATGSLSVQPGKHLRQ